MKHFFTLLIILAVHAAYAQAPQSIPYQAVVRNTDGSVLSNTPITMTFKIHDVSATGTVVYEESHTTSSNAQGLVALNVGGGTPITGTFSNITWGNGAKFLHVLMNAGNGVIDLGTQQMMSVPYAFYADNSASWIINEDTTSTKKAVYIDRLTAPVNYPDFQLEGANFTDMIIANQGNGDPSIWLRDVDSSLTWRIHNDQSQNNVFSIRHWTDYPGYNGSSLAGENHPPFSIDTQGKVSIGSSVNFDEAFNVYDEVSSFINIETSGNNDAGLKFCELSGARGGRIYTDGNGSNNVVYQVTDNLGNFVDVMYMPYFPDSKVGNVGIGIVNPSRNLHIKDTMRLEPRNSAPTSAAEGDMYFDGITKKLRVFDGTVWRDCW